MPQICLHEMSCAPRHALFTLVAIAQVAALCRKETLQGLGEERNHRLIFTVKCRYIHNNIQKAQPKQNRHVFFFDK